MDTLKKHGFSPPLKKEDNVPRWGWTPTAYCLFKCSLIALSSIHIHFSHFIILLYIALISLTFSDFSLWGTFWVVITLFVQESRVTCHNHTGMVYRQCEGLKPPTFWLQDQHTNHYTILYPPIKKHGCLCLSMAYNYVCVYCKIKD